jgi:hypothetical protein
MGIYPILIPKYPIIFGYIPNTHTQKNLIFLGILGVGIGYIPHKIGYLDMSIGRYPYELDILGMGIG